MTFPETPSTTADDESLRSVTTVVYAFCSALVMVGVLGVFVLVPAPTVTPAGLLIGALLGLVAWFLPGPVIRLRLTTAARDGVPPELVAGVVRSVVFVGVALAEAPALVGLVIAVQLGHDVGPLVLSIPLAVASLILNVGGKGAVRRHLDRLRSPSVF